MQTFQRRMRDYGLKALNGAIDAVLPHRCVMSGDLVEKQGMMSPKIWAGLDFITPPFCECCGFPFEFEVSDGALCAQCLADSPPFEYARSALKYNDTSRSMILGFKHADKMHIARSFTPWLKRTGGVFLDQADLIIPVPLHYRRLIARRYNQAAVMAHFLSKETRKPYIADALQRTRSTVSQGHLKAKERAKNVRRAFQINQKHALNVRGKKILLIDDVYTTGATIKECTKALMKAEVKTVFVLTLARVVRDGF